MMIFVYRLKTDKTDKFHMKANDLVKDDEMLVVIVFNQSYITIVERKTFWKSGSKPTCTWKPSISDPGNVIVNEIIDKYKNHSSITRINGT